MLPHYYHFHHSRFVDDLPLWSRLAAEQGGPILELGCGTGRVSLPLARAGYPVYGIDHDAGMLAVLRAQLAQEPKSAVFLCQAVVSHFHLAMDFPLVIMPCNTISTLSEAERRSMLSCVRNILQAGGVFAASMPNPLVLMDHPIGKEGMIEIEDVFTHPVSGNPVQISSLWERTVHQFVIHWFYDHLLPQGEVERAETSIYHHLVPLRIFQDELGIAGLSITQVYGDYTGEAYQHDSPHLILVAQVD